MKRGGLLFLGVIALLGLFPLVANPYHISLFILIFMYIALAQSWNIISGYTGYISFGHVSFFGVGAYTATLLIVRLGYSWPIASVLGGAAATILSVIVGYPCLRLKGPFFAIAMLGLSQLLMLIVMMLTGGGEGLALPPIVKTVPTYYAMGLTAMGVGLLTYKISKSKLGLRLMAIREDEVAAEVMGINTTNYKLSAFMLSAFFPGLAGGINAWYVSYIDPPSVFTVLISIQMVIMTMFGGSGTVLGPVLGAVVISLLSEFFWARFPFLHQGLLGVLIVVVILFIPRGIMGLLKDRGWA
ncbi:MAG: branched-chain amino acid ABC transporter permease [Nitrospinota bacterium]